MKIQNLLKNYVWTVVLAAGMLSEVSATEPDSSATILKQVKGAVSNTSQQSSSIVEDEIFGAKLRISGFVRVIGFYRKMDEYYTDVPVLTPRGLNMPTHIGIGDGSANPNLMLNFEISPTSKTSILVETGFHHNFNNPGEVQDVASESNDKVASIFSRFAISGKTRTRLGTFTLTAGGGMNWAKISPFTLWTFQYRDDMFERYPWDPAGSNWGRYNSFYSMGDIPRDMRWGNRSTQGFKLDMEDLPNGWSSTLLVGKTSVSGGWQNYLTGIPQNVVAGRIGKRLGGVEVGVNYFNQFGFDEALYRIDSTIVIDDVKYKVQTNRTSQQTVTGDFRWNLPNIRIYSEFGMGSYFSGSYIHKDTVRSNWSENRVNRYKRIWSPVAYAEFDVKKGLFGFPFQLKVYHVGKSAVNNSSAIINSSNEEATDGRNLNQLGASNNNTLYIESMIAEIGQITNNRQGINFQHTHQFGKLIVDLGLGIEQEIENLALDSTMNGGMRDGVRNSVSFYHIVNQYQRSRFDYINRGWGPYNRLLSDFRRSWENVAITDTVIDYKKSFNMLDLSLKYKTTFLGKEIILAGFTRYNSVQDKISPIPVMGERAFVRQFYKEAMAFYHIHAKWTIITFFGHQTVKGNQRTELADADGNPIMNNNGASLVNDNNPVANGHMNFVTVVDPETNVSTTTKQAVEGGKPIDQVAIGYGAGFSYDFNDRASVDLRYRRYKHEDKAFTKDRFKGQEVTVELKVFF